MQESNQNRRSHGFSKKNGQSEPSSLQSSKLNGKGTGIGPLNGKKGQLSSFLIQDTYPVEVKNLQSIPTELKQYISDLQAEYIMKHNLLLANRGKYERIIESLAIELDQRGVSSQEVSKYLKNSSYHYNFAE